MKQAIRTFSYANHPIYAECGGLMYLGNRLTTDSGTFDMLGLLDGESEMTPRLKRFGYCEASPVVNTVIGAAGVKLVGHEFHHSVFTANAGLEPVLRMRKVRDGVVADEWTGGYQVRQTFASYLHVHFYQSKTVFNGLLDRLGARVHASH
jgi:Cobyrinic acid a,c-diamide synthase